MPTLSSINGTQLLDLLGINAGASIGAFSAAAIDARETRLATLGDIAEELAYCQGLLTAAGYAPILSDANYSNAVRALAFGAGYRYAQLDYTALAVHPGAGDSNNAAMKAARTQCDHFFARANAYYMALGIESKYYEPPSITSTSISY